MRDGGISKVYLGSKYFDSMLIEPIRRVIPDCTSCYIQLALPLIRPRLTSTPETLRLRKRTAVVIQALEGRPIILPTRPVSSETFREEKTPHNAITDLDNCTLPATNWALHSKLVRIKLSALKKALMSQSTIVQERRPFLTRTSETIK